MTTASVIATIALFVMVVAFCAAIFLVYIKLENLEKKISSANNEPAPEIDMGELANLAIASWRLDKIISKMEGRLDHKDKKRLENVSRQFKTFLNAYDVKADDYSGRRFNEGMNVVVVACEDDDSSEFDYVKETEKPAIYIGGSIYKRSSIIVARGTKKKEAAAEKKEDS